MIYHKIQIIKSSHCGQDFIKVCILWTVEKLCVYCSSAKKYHVCMHRHPHTQNEI